MAAAIYFVQDETFEIPPHAQHMQELEQPIYKTNSKHKKEKLYEEIFDHYNGIVDIGNIKIKEIKEHFEQYHNNEKSIVLYNNKPYAHINTNDIYTFMYQVDPIAPIIADDGEEYILFQFVESLNLNY